MTTAVLGKWGNAMALRIPQNICKELGISYNDVVSLEVRDSKLIIGKPLDAYTLKGRMNDWNGERYKSDELDWGEPVGKEIW